MKRTGGVSELLLGITILFFVVMFLCSLDIAKTMGQQNDLINKLSLQNQKQKEEIASLTFDLETWKSYGHNLIDEVSELNKKLANKCSNIDELNKKLTGKCVAESSEVATLTIETYKIEVKNCSLKETVGTGKYDYVEKNILEYFESEPIVPGKKEVFLINFHRNISSVQVIYEMEKRNLRPANIWDQLAFGEQYPDFDRILLVALGSFCKDDRCYPTIPLHEYSSFGKRCLHLELWGHNWGLNSRFLAVKK